MTVLNTAGVFRAEKKDGTEYYRASITYKKKHIGLGSFDTYEEASRSYAEGKKIVKSKISINRLIDRRSEYIIPFDKAVTLVNYRDNGMYIANPVYISKSMFYYYLSPDDVIKFDAEDLFYFISHKIMKRGNHLFVNEFNKQVNVHSRYGIRPHSREGRDYRFINGDSLDFRRSNIEIINTYYGVEKAGPRHRKKYRAYIYINGVVTIGYYDTDIEAAIAYNKVVDILKKSRNAKEYPVNTEIPVSKEDYADIYSRVEISEKISKNMER